jgi:hypothetical protein
MLLKSQSTVPSANRGLGSVVSEILLNKSRTSNDLSFFYSCKWADSFFESYGFIHVHIIIK